MLVDEREKNLHLPGVEPGSSTSNMWNAANSMQN